MAAILFLANTQLVYGLEAGSYFRIYQNKLALPALPHGNAFHSTFSLSGSYLLWKLVNLNLSICIYIHMHVYQIEKCGSLSHI